MKGLWKTKVGGYSKDTRRKSCTKNQVFSDNSAYNIKHKKYNVIGDEFYYFKGERVPYDIVFGRLGDLNKKRQFETNIVDRKTRARVREYIAKGDWETEIKDVYGSKSVDWLVS